MSPQQSAVQCPCAGDQFFTVRSFDDKADQLVNGRITDSHKVPRTAGFSGFTTPVIVLFIAWRKRLSYDHHKHVKIKGSDAVNIL